MSDHKLSEARRLARDLCWLAFTWACYRLIMVWPHPRYDNWNWRAYLAVLPFAGMYGYSETWSDFRECVSFNAGRSALSSGESA